MLPDSPQPEVTLPTDSYGKAMYPIVDPQGNLLATDPSTGQYLNRHNQPIEIQRDDSGRPLDPQGNLLPTDPQNRYIFKDPRVSLKRKLKNVASNCPKFIINVT